MPYRVCSVYDTETCNLIDGCNSKAYAVLYQFNDLRGIDVREYVAGETDDFRLFRHRADVLDYLANLIEWASEPENRCIPVVCAYNLMFDLRSLMFDLSMTYEMEVNAQSSTSVYTLDLKSGRRTLLRFWDCFYLEQRGLSAMGRVAGLPKATGDWDYDLVRTPDTELTEEEVFYATRDVQVIPAYLAWLMRSNEFLTSDMLGRTIVTKTSIVRQMARFDIAPLRYPRSHCTVGSSFYRLCANNLPADFERYALRRACFRGGLTFTAASMASVVCHNVASLDVISMHHTFMSAEIPVRFCLMDSETLQGVAERVVSTSRERVLTHYCRPFDYGLHVKVRFENLRLREGSAFAHWGIATLARAKVSSTVEHMDDFTMTNDATRIQEVSNRAGGWHDSVSGVEVAFGKVYAARRCDVFLNEVELWICSRVYEWDSMRVLFGEMACNFRKPPAYVGLQSMKLFETKSAMKRICTTYVEGVPYEGDVSPLVPESIAAEVRAGTADMRFLESYYTSTVKGMFNGIYGTQAQDVFKAGYVVGLDGEVQVDESDVCRPENFDSKVPDRCKVLYTYGMRIVGRSRMHLALAIELLHEAFGSRVDVCGGDTDSLKARCDYDVTDADLLGALEPLHDAADVCLSQGYRDIRVAFPALSSEMPDVGHFDVERCGRSRRYPYHLELWNKCRMSIDSDLRPHVTAAGLSRPRDGYNINDYIDDRIEDCICEGRSIDDALYEALGYNVFVDSSVAHSLGRTNPKTTAMVDATVRDWRGAVCRVREPEVMALYPQGRDFGSLVTATANENIAYLARHYGRHPRKDYRVISR